MGNDHSGEAPPEEDNDLDFNETTVDVPAPPDPNTAEEHNFYIKENIEGATAISVKGISSEYHEIKETILDRSKETGKSYVYKDQEFPDDKQSLYYSTPPSRWHSIVWKRPKDISSDPRLIKDGMGSEDIVQGQLGDCWFLASCAAISRSPKFLSKVVPPDQYMTGEDYVGMFHFRFWRFGKWVDVIIDDNLPTINGYLCFARSQDHNEYWLPLVEKAYAKLNYSYQAIEGGFTQDGLEDLTGGVAINYDLGDKTPDHLFYTLHKALRNQSFACAGIGGTTNVEDKTTGLVSAHAYSVLRVARANYQDGKVSLVKLRNPWGGTIEWTGDWSDRSYKWDNMDEETKNRLGHTDSDNGEWWMSFDDFARYFNNVTICTIGPDFDNDGEPTGDRWLLSTINGRWISGSTAGGSRNSVYSYATNPQYLVELIEPDEFDPEEDDPSQRGKCSLVVGLMQEYRRVGKAEGLTNLYLALNIFKVNERPQRKLDARYFGRNREVLTSGTYVNRREVTITSECTPGYYVIVPSTFNADEEGSFLIRVFTEKRIDVTELT